MNFTLNLEHQHMTGKNLINKGIKMKKNMITLLFLALTFTLFGAECETWIAGSRGYAVGETCSYQGKYYICIKSVDSSTSPVDTWFWEETDQCDASIGTPPTAIDFSTTELIRSDTVGTIIGTFSVTDPDSVDVITISLPDDASTMNRYFSVSGTNLVLDSSFYDYELDSISLLIRATDSFGQYLEKVLSLTLTTLAIEEDYSEWQYNRKLTLNTSSTGVVLDSTLNNIVLQMTFDSSWFDFSHSQANQKE